jgi:hypothetical protein
MDVLPALHETLRTRSRPRTEYRREQAMPGIFHDFDLQHFWEDSDYARKAYVEARADGALVASVEEELGVRLPRSYLELMQVQNGGIPVNRCFPTKGPTGWAEDHVAISGILGIGRTQPNSLCGSHGSAFMKSEWGYPDIGVCICDCPSAGHEMIMLDYRECGPTGEPQVVHVDQELDYETTFLAKDFETFVRGLVNESVYDTSAEELEEDLANIDLGAFSTRRAGLIAASGRPELGPILRRVCRQLTVDKQRFALHADEASHLVYDIQFYLFAASNRVTSRNAYLEAYPEMLALGDGAFGTGGYAPGFVEDWLEERVLRGQIVATPAGHLSFSEGFARELEAKLRSLGAR